MPAGGDGTSMRVASSMLWSTLPLAGTSSPAKIADQGGGSAGLVYRVLAVTLMVLRDTTATLSRLLDLQLLVGVLALLAVAALGG